jgi:hypothetical protein
LTLFDSLIQRLQDAGVHRGNHIHRRVQLFFGHPRFPCVRKAPFDSWVAQPHHRNGQADEHLFTVRETFDSVGVAVESTKIGFLQNASLLSDSTLVSGLESGKIPLSSPFLQRGKEGDLKLKT